MDQQELITAKGARGLLLTVLGEFVLPNGHSTWTQTLVETMGHLGVRDKSARQAIARMHGRGWLERTRVGRQTRWTLSATSVDVLEAGAARIYAFGSDKRQWDGRWVLLLASVPERDRKLRYRMSDGLNFAGFGSLGQGTWISPWLGEESTAVALLRDLGVEATSFRADLGDMASPAAMVGQAWDLPSLRLMYDRFLIDHPSFTGRGLVGVDAVVALARLVHEWRVFPLVDPDLPRKLLPDDWPGIAAAQRCVELRSTLRSEAMTWWQSTDEAYG